MKNSQEKIYNKYIKRCLDFTVSSIVFVALLPLFFFLILFGTIAMKGNPFFTQERPGKIDVKTGREKCFKLIKFRTMSNAKDKNGNLLPDEKRLNRYGKILRATSLDELGELLNIIKGDMSIVGPRPLLMAYLPYYTQEEHHRHDVRPGLTGLAQISGRNTVGWDRRLQLDLEYINSVSFSNDLKICCKTVGKVLTHSGVSEKRITPLDVERREKQYSEIQ